MNKKAVGTGVACGIFLGTTIIAYAITSLFFTKSETSKLSKKTVFQFDLSTDMAATKVEPGDSFDVKPVIYTTITGYAMGTEDMSTNPVDAWNECKTIGDIQ